MQHRFFCLRGFMKSGTNWVGSLLSSHSEISCVGEFHWQAILEPFNRNLNNLPLYNELLPELKGPARDNLEAMIRQTLIAAAEPTSSLIGDRTPHTLMPIVMRGVPHISVIRDGRDVLVSRAFHLYNHPEVAPVFERIPEMARALEAFQKDPWFFQKNPQQLLCHEELVRLSARWWRDHLASDQRTVERFPNLPVHFLRYEDLHADTKGERRKMFEFLGVDPTRAANLVGVLKPGFKRERPDEFLRKGVVGDWKNYFFDDSKAWFKEVAGQTLIDYGYVESMDW